jgi:hypothetical protein
MDNDTDTNAGLGLRVSKALLRAAEEALSSRQATYHGTKITQNLVPILH